MNVWYVWALADEQTMVTTAPVVVVEIVVNSIRGGHRKRSEVFHNGEVHTIGYEFGPDLGSHRKQAVQSGDGNGKIGLMVAQIVAVEH